MRVEVLGSIRLIGEHGPVEIGSRTQRLILAVLGSRRGSVVPTHVLVDAIWGEAPPASATRTLRSYLSRLRTHLGPAIVQRGGGYALELGAADVDADAFEAELEAARHLPPDQAVEALERADRCWYGSAFGEFAGEPTIAARAQHLERRRLDGRELRAGHLLAIGRSDEAAADAARVLADDPLRESAWVVLIDAQRRRSPATALRSYRRACEALAEVGLDPSPALRDAERRALAGADVTGSASETPSGGAPPAGRSRTDLRGTIDAGHPLIGRDDDVRTIASLLGAHRLVTLVGPGGVGKTVLARRTAAEVAARNGGGACFVALERIGEASAVPGVIAEAVGISSAAAPAEDLNERIGALDMLIVLDNCEHLGDGLASVVAQLVRPGGSATVLCTSRQRLGVAAERVHRVGPLPTRPGGAGDRLFVERTEQSGVDELDRQASARIVSLLDGLPLAIEMAAALVPTLGTDELQRLLTRDVSVLRAPTRAAPDRHRTLASLIDWSLESLSSPMRAAAEALSIFDGPFDVDAASAVLGSEDAVAALHELAERSLLIRDDVVHGHRLRMLVPIRDHIRRVADPDRRTEARRRHLDHHLELARETDAMLRGATEAAGHQRFSSALADLGAAHRWACEHAPEAAETITVHAHVWALSRQVGEPFRWAGRLRADRPGLAAVQSQAAFLEGDVSTAMRLAERALDDATGIDELLALEAMSDIQLATGALDAARATSRRLRHAADRCDDAHMVTLGVVGESLALSYSGARDAALDLLQGDALPPAPTDRGWWCYGLAEATASDDPEHAAAMLVRSISEADSVGNRFLGGVSRVSLAALRSQHGDPGESLADVVGVVEHWQRHGVSAYLVTALRNLAVLLERMGEPTRAAHVLGAVTGPGVVPTYGEEAIELQRVERSLRASLGDHAFGRAFRAGAAAGATELVHELSELADGASAPGSR